MGKERLLSYGPYPAVSLAKARRKRDETRELLAEGTDPAAQKYTREALRVAVAARMGAADVLEVLYPLLLRRGKPEYIRSDNGPEFTAEPFKEWLKRVGIEPIHIYPGSPWENGYNEWFNGALRRELLNTEWFASIRQAQIVINQWLRQYNHIRPHHALGMRAPVPETLIEKSQISGPDIGG